jgi:hypothetical protein
MAVMTRSGLAGRRRHTGRPLLFKPFYTPCRRILSRLPPVRMGARQIVKEL